jgi:tetraacyldisaccharide 4'-kinase
MIRPDAIKHLQRLWVHGGPANWMLRVLSMVYGATVSLNQGLFRTGILRQYRVSVPVIVVGNVLAGGAGKTPTLMAMIRHLQSSGWTVGVISKGYGRRSKACIAVHPDSLAIDVGDEPLLIAKRCQVPVVVANRRVEAAKALLQSHPQIQIIVADDGLQHMALGRDLELVVFDERGLGNKRLLPAGWLREPWPRRWTCGASMVLQTAPTATPAPAPCTWNAQRTLVPWAVNGKGERKSLQDLAGGRVVAFAGIAKPQAFFSMLTDSGIGCVKTIALADHFDFSHWQLPGANDGAAVDAYLCTEKDAVKLWDRFPQVWAVGLELKPEPSFFEALDTHLAAWATKASSSQISARDA